MTEPRDKAEGWYLLHDMRKFDWKGWNSADGRTQEDALDEAVEFLEDVGDAEKGDTAIYTVVGDKADLMFLHVRPTLEEIDAVERSFERTRLADFTDETASHVSVTEVGGYTNEDVGNDDLSGYARSKLFPEIPDKSYVSFYPMSRKRAPEQNWYKTTREHRNEMMHEHRESGEKYAGKIKQLISGSIGMDDWEWGVDLFTDDMKHAKGIVYEMRFDEASADYSEFGPFYTGIRMRPSDLETYVSGERVPADEGDKEATGVGESVRETLDEEGVYAGKPHGEDVYAVVLFSEEDAEALGEEVDGLRGNFEHYDTHVKTAVYGDVEDGDAHTAVVSIWDTQDAADTASGFLSDLPGVVKRAGNDDEGFGTMGMFYTVKPDYREEFVEKFGDVGDHLADMDGHIESRLLANVDDENDMFISSRWGAKEDAMEFFRSDAFRDTVDWGREILDDRPRHVFLA
ncbi:MAG: heme-binding protein [Halobacteriales archaeon]|nr:heme-binding protein [Halobacteriales archaeon]